MILGAWLSSCASMHAVRPDLFNDWGECARLHDACGEFFERVLQFRTDYEWYPAIEKKMVFVEQTTPKPKKGSKHIEKRKGRYRRKYVRDE